MNIFYFHSNPSICAKWLCDVHVVSQVKETAQILCTVTNERDQFKSVDGLWKSTHKNHPSVRWAGDSVSNFTWTCVLFADLLEEYHHRFSKQHGSTHLIEPLTSVLSSLKTDGKQGTLPPACVSDRIKKMELPVTFAYRLYYNEKKQTMKRPMVWTNRTKPEWMVG